jgi:uncharacterized membrane protein YdjX (TVP38/TMEM64 family)
MRWALVTVLLLALILVPFVLFEAQFEQIGTRISSGELARWPAATALAVFLALDVFLPVPSSLVSTAAGALLGFAAGTLTIWVGMTVGCGLAYLVGSRASGLARRLVGDDGLRRASEVAERYGSWAIVVSRPVPVLAEASVILAGLIQVDVARFLILSALANLGIAAAYAAIGAYSMGVGSFLATFVGALILPGLAMLAGRRWLGTR